MALLKATTKRLDIPHEPGEWIEIRRLSTLGDLDGVEMTKGRQARINEMARYFFAAIVAWSYPEPPSTDAIAGKPNANGDREGGLDDKTATWLLTETGKLRDSKTDAELLATSSPSTTR